MIACRYIVATYVNIIRKPQNGVSLYLCTIQYMVRRYVSPDCDSSNLKRGMLIMLSLYRANTYNIHRAQ